MSWFSLPKVFAWDQQHPEAVLDRSFSMIDHTLDPQLAREIDSHLPQQEGEKFKATLANRFNLTLISVLDERALSKVLLTMHTVQNHPKQKVALRITQVNSLRGEEKKLFFSLDNKEKLFGIEWHIFLSGTTPFPRPHAAIAWNHTTNKFEVLTRQQITDHHSGRNLLPDPYTLYATLSPYISDNSPYYVNATLSPETYNTLSPYIPKNLQSKNLFLSMMATTLRNLEIIKPLGEGSFSQVWEVTFTSIDNAQQHMALKIAKTGSVGTQEFREKYFQISRNRFGGEFAAFLPEGPSILSSYFAIVWDQNKATFRLVSGKEINRYHKNLELMGTNVLTLYGTLSEYHEGATTLKELMQTQQPGKAFDIEKIRTYAYQLLLGLADFPKNMIHRDLKPANILVTKEGLLKILDFGFSAVSADMAQSVVGTPLCMPPEVYQNIPYDQKSDLYSLYCIFFKMATGEYPIHEKNYLAQKLEIGKAISEKKDPKNDPRLKSFDEPFRCFLSHLGHVDPEKRWTLKKILESDSFLQIEEALPPPRQASPPPQLIASYSILTPISSFLNLHQYVPSPPSLVGRINKTFFLGGAAFVLYHVARRVFIIWNKPRWQALTK